MIARYYAARHPSQITGIVLVDPPIEHETERVSKLVPDFEKMTRMQIEHVRQCASAKDLTGDCAPGAPDDAPPAVAERLRATARAHDLVGADEMEAAMDGRDDSEIAAVSTDLGNVPLIVLTSEQFKTNQHMPPQLRSAAQNQWMTFHDEIAARSKKGSNRVVAGTGHYVQLERSEAVVAAVIEVAAAAKNSVR